MFDESYVLPVPGVELVALVDRTISQSTGTAEAVTPSKLIVIQVSTPPNCAGVITIRQVLAVAATNATADEESTPYPTLLMPHPQSGSGWNRTERRTPSCLRLQRRPSACRLWSRVGHRSGAQPYSLHADSGVYNLP